MLARVGNKGYVLVLVLCSPSHGNRNRDPAKALRQKLIAQAQTPAPSWRDCKAEHRARRWRMEMEIYVQGLTQHQSSRLAASTQKILLRVLNTGDDQMDMVITSLAIVRPIRDWREK